MNNDKVSHSVVQCGSLEVMFLFLYTCQPNPVSHVFSVSTMSTLKVSVSEKKAMCVQLQQKLEALEKDTAAKLVQMDQFNKDMQVKRETTEEVFIFI